MTPFELKRLEFLKKCAANYDHVRLGPSDLDIFKKLLKPKKKTCHLENCLACIVYKDEEVEGIS